MAQEVTEEKGGRHGAERHGGWERMQVLETVKVVGMMSVDMDWHAWTDDHGGAIEGGGHTGAWWG